MKYLANDTVYKIVGQIWDDIYGRCEGDWWLDSIDEKTQEEMRETWSEIVRKAVEEEK